jgi:hypothetical protein
MTLHQRPTYQTLDEFLDSKDESDIRTVSFWWPLAPGEWWAPNFSAGGGTPLYSGRDPDPDRHAWAPGDLVMGFISPNRSRILRGQGGKRPTSEVLGAPFKYHVSFWGADDTYMETPYPSQWSKAETVAFIRSLPNPITKSWLSSRGFGG